MPRPVTFTILRDKREKRPLSFPDWIDVLDPNTLPRQRQRLAVRIRVQDVTLPTADYVLGKDAANVYTLGETAVVERKYTLDEIATNVLDIHRRKLFVGQLQRMRETWKYPLLVFEGGLERLYKPTIHTPCPGIVVSALLRLGFEYGVSIIPIPSATANQRRLLSEHVAQILVNGALCNGQP